MSEEYKSPCTKDHDELLKLKTQFEEFRFSNEQRLEKLNELREAVTKDRSEFMRRDVYDTYHQNLVHRVNAIETWQAKIIGVGLVIAAIMTVIGTVIGHEWK